MGIDFQALTIAAYQNVAERLEDFGNTLSDPHREGLMAQAGLFTKKAQGKLPGRQIISLAPGLGKTQGVVGWIKALVEQGHDHVGVGTFFAQCVVALNAEDRARKLEAMTLAQAFEIVTGQPLELDKPATP